MMTSCYRNYGFVLLLTSLSLSFSLGTNTAWSQSKLEQDSPKKSKKRSQAPFHLYLESSLAKVAELTGTEARALETFMNSVRLAPGEEFSAPESSQPFLPGLHPCLPKEEISTAERNRILTCLGTLGRPGLTVEMFKALHQVRVQLESKSPPTDDEQKTVQLFAWLEDIHRQYLANHVAGGAAWFYGPRQSFLEISHHSEFDYQDGDVLVEMGSSSISAAISSITGTPYRASHGLMIRVREGKKTTVESLIETGVEEFRWEHFEKGKIKAVVVLRLKSPPGQNWSEETLKLIRMRASDIAMEQVERNARYDFYFDMMDSEKIFCNELVLYSYVRAVNEITGSNYTVRDLAPFASGIPTEKRFQFVEAWGVKNRDMAAPGDLIKSPFFEVIADYKYPKNFLDSWKLAIGGQVLMDRIEQGYEVYPPVYIFPLSWVAEVASFATSPTREDTLVPQGMPTQALRVTITLEKVIKKNLVEDVAEQMKEAGLQDNILGIAPWELMAMLDHSIDGRRAVRWAFRKP